MRQTLNNPEATDLRNKGPIPVGRYTLVPGELSDPNSLYDIARTLRHGDWGDWRISLHPQPGTKTFGRSGFFIHGGRFPGSAGCIDIGGGIHGNEQTDKLKALISKQQRDITLQVMSGKLLWDGLDPQYQQHRNRPGIQYA